MTLKLRRFVYGDNADTFARDVQKLLSQGWSLAPETQYVKLFVPPPRRPRSWQDAFAMPAIAYCEITKGGFFSVVMERDTKEMAPEEINTGDLPLREALRGHLKTYWPTVARLMGTTRAQIAASLKQHGLCWQDVPDSDMAMLDRLMEAMGRSYMPDRWAEFREFGFNTDTNVALEKAGIHTRAELLTCTFKQLRDDRKLPVAACNDIRDKLRARNLHLPRRALRKATD